jgi:hypothetical protein
LHIEERHILLATAAVLVGSEKWLRAFCPFQDDQHRHVGEMPDPTQIAPNSSKDVCRGPVITGLAGPKNRRIVLVKEQKKQIGA